MPTRDTALTGAPCWIDLLTSDPDQSRAFYRELFGWTSEEAGEEYGGYINFAKDGAGVAGCMRNDGSAGMADGWSLYLTSDDADRTAEDTAAHGGQVLMPPMDVMDLGRMALVNDVGGASIGVWQPGQHQGFDIIGEAGAPAWFELHTRDYERSVTFYQDVFKWDAHTMSDTPEFRYTTLGEGEHQSAGIMDATAMLSGDESAHWSIYFGVEDTDKALEHIADLGGNVITPADDSPYGRLAQAADPTGARFKLVSVS